jgi:hypothetical protein
MEIGCSEECIHWCRRHLSVVTQCSALCLETMLKLDTCYGSDAPLRHRLSLTTVQSSSSGLLPLFNPKMLGCVTTT